MTLILTEISKLGIAMAADSAVTTREISPSGQFIQQVLKGVTKLHLIHKLDAGISIWGQGRIDGVSSNIWLEDFIRTKEEEYDTLSSFASLLQEELRRYIPDIDVSNPRFELGTIGFHLAGFVDWGGRLTPTFYHIHNGKSQVLEMRGEGDTIDPRRVNANHDVPPDIARKLLDEGKAFLIRNGDFRPFAVVIESLSKSFEDLANELILIIPYSRSLEDRANWLKFEIKTMAELYSFSNKASVIGGDIATLTISEDGTNYRPK